MRHGNRAEARATEALSVQEWQPPGAPEQRPVISGSACKN